MTEPTAAPASAAAPDSPDSPSAPSSPGAIDPCDSLHAYVDDELSGAETAAFEEHLATCARCGDELPRLLALLDALDRTGGRAGERTGGRAGEPAPEVQDARSVAFAVLPGGKSAEPAPPPRAEPGAVAAASARAASPLRRRWWLAGAPLAAAAAVLVAVAAWPHPAAPDFALGATRALDARLDYPGAGDYRPHDVSRGGASAADDHLLALALAFERAGDWHGAAVASLLVGNPTRAREAFARAPATPEVDVDRAALELVDGQPAALERGLGDLDRARGAHPETAAAQWNRALILAAMNLPLAAARELDAIRARGERGWSDEAAVRAGELRAQASRRSARWTRASGEGAHAVEDGSPTAGVDPDEATAAADQARGDAAAAERDLRAAIDRARAGHAAYRAVRLARDLVHLLQIRNQLDAAADAAQLALRDAVAAGEWGLETGALSDLAAIHGARGADPVVRAYQLEISERRAAGLPSTLPPTAL
jgi:anti-sigma factor RsiW